MHPHPGRASAGRTTGQPALVPGEGEVGTKPISDVLSTGKGVRENVLSPRKKQRYRIVDRWRRMGVVFGCNGGKEDGVTGNVTENRRVRDEWRLLRIRYRAGPRSGSWGGGPWRLGILAEMPRNAKPVATVNHKPIDRGYSADNHALEC